MTTPKILTLRTNGQTAQEREEQPKDKPGAITRFIQAGGIALLLGLYTGVSGIQDSIDRNCRATATVGEAVKAVVSVDNELSRNTPESRLIKQTLRRIHEDCG